MINIFFRYDDSVMMGPVLKNSAEILENLFNHYGSDKSLIHKYHEIYGPCLGALKTSKGLCIEIGLGTNDPKIPSNMCGTGNPGGSLRSLKNFFPFINVVGCDIDKNILFAEERITTFFLNQLMTETFSELLTFVEEKRGFDFAIIDGLHQPLADLNTVRLLLPYILVNGMIFVEDIQPNWYSRLSWQFFKVIAPKSIVIENKTTSSNSQIVVISRKF